MPNVSAAIGQKYGIEPTLSYDGREMYYIAKIDMNEEIAADIAEEKAAKKALQQSRIDLDQIAEDAVEQLAENPPAFVEEIVENIDPTLTTDEAAGEAINQIAEETAERLVPAIMEEYVQFEYPPEVAEDVYENLESGLREELNYYETQESPEERYDKIVIDLKERLTKKIAHEIIKPKNKRALNQCLPPRKRVGKLTMKGLKRCIIPPCREGKTRNGKILKSGLKKCKLPPMTEEQKRIRRNKMAKKRRADAKKELMPAPKRKPAKKKAATKKKATKKKIATKKKATKKKATKKKTATKKKATKKKTTKKKGVRGGTVIGDLKRYYDGTAVIPGAAALAAVGALGIRGHDAQGIYKQAERERLYQQLLEENITGNEPINIYKNYDDFEKNLDGMHMQRGSGIVKKAKNFYKKHKTKIDQAAKIGLAAAAAGAAATAIGSEANKYRNQRMDDSMFWKKDSGYEGDVEHNRLGEEYRKMKEEEEFMRVYNAQHALKALELRQQADQKRAMERGSGIVSEAKKFYKKHKTGIKRGAVGLATLGTAAAIGYAANRNPGQHMSNIGRMDEFAGPVYHPSDMERGYEQYNRDHTNLREKMREAQLREDMTNRLQRMQG